MMYRKLSKPRHYLSPVTTVVVRERFRPSCMLLTYVNTSTILPLRLFSAVIWIEGFFCYGLSQLSSPEDQRRLAPKLVGFLFILNQNINPISLDLGTSIFRNPPSKSGNEHTRAIGDHFRIHSDRAPNDRISTDGCFAVSQNLDVINRAWTHLIERKQCMHYPGIAALIGSQEFGNREDWLRLALFFLRFSSSRFNRCGWGGRYGCECGCHWAVAKS